MLGKAPDRAPVSHTPIKCLENQNERDGSE
jgi:hypothetical protein